MCPPAQPCRVSHRRGTRDRAGHHITWFYDCVGCMRSSSLLRSMVFCGSANCVRDTSQPQPQPQCSSPALLCSDNDEGASIVKGSRVEVCIASPFDFKGKVCWYGSCSFGVSLSRHRHSSA